MSIIYQKQVTRAEIHRNREFCGKVQIFHNFDIEIALFLP